MCSVRKSDLKTGGEGVIRWKFVDPKESNLFPCLKTKIGLLGCLPFKTRIVFFLAKRIPRRNPCRFLLVSRPVHGMFLRHRQDANMVIVPWI